MDNMRNLAAQTTNGTKSSGAGPTTIKKLELELSQSFSPESNQSFNSKGSSNWGRVMDNMRNLAAQTTNGTGSPDSGGGITHVASISCGTTGEKQISEQRCDCP
jgi:hypothetical protein